MPPVCDIPKIVRLRALIEAGHTERDAANRVFPTHNSRDANVGIPAVDPRPPIPRGDMNASRILAIDPPLEGGSDVNANAGVFTIDPRVLLAASGDVSANEDDTNELRNTTKRKGQRFTSAEDKIIKQMKEEGKKGREIAEMLRGYGREWDKKTINAHYSDLRRQAGLLRPPVAKPYTSKEFALMKKMREKGNPWNIIAGKFPGRSADSMRVRYRARFPEKAKHYKRFTEEDDKVIKRMKGDGYSWKEIAGSVGGRTACNVRYRYW
ncbi:MAG: hypothetical protein M1839_003018 [Geoglossum umbratile]|nr:MAG: hypothetical protein M1839_003018 [Geoglossum umbratile]